MKKWLQRGREIGIILLLSLLLVFVSFGVSLYSVWEYRTELASLRVEKGLLMAVLTYQIGLGILLYWKLSSLVVRSHDYILFYSAPILLYIAFNRLLVGIFFLVLFLITLVTVYRIRRLARTAHDFRKTERFEHGRDHTIPI